jgi:hypothetical protein
MGNQEGQLAQGSPTKDFFVRMITRDISLADCIMDLVDNAIDGAHRIALSKSKTPSPESLSGFEVVITPTASKIEIKDNCGGISLTNAINYAFHFGRRKDAPHDVNGSIGLYGIGMKRAIFKMGRYAKVESITAEDKFSVIVNVDEWLNKETDWDFDIEPAMSTDPNGTSLQIERLNPAVSLAFADQSFINSLVRTMARDYAFVLNKGFSIKVKTPKETIPVPKYNYKLKEDVSLAPGVIAYVDEGVDVRIIAGLIDELPDEIPDELRPDKTDAYGWYVICNDRLVVAGDKTAVTVWGNNNFPGWHPQYNGFGGFVFMNSGDDASKLPWRTTKREVDTDDPIYKRAVVRMQELTRQFITYSNDRKDNPGAAKDAERQAPAVNIVDVKSTETKMKLPRVTPTNKEKMITVAYPKPLAKVKKAAEAFGDFSLSAREVGSKAFDYFYKNEVEE